MKLSDIPTERLKQVAENFGSSTVNEVTFFQYAPLGDAIDAQERIESTTTTFTKNEILEELEARQFRQELRD